MLMEYVDCHPDATHGAERRKTHRSMAALAWLGLLVGVAIVLSGCLSDIAPEQPPPVATVEPAEHQLRIIAVDFDPPLDYTQLVSNDGVTLMVAVENQGQGDETGVRVSARLLNPNVVSQAVGILDETVVLTEVPAGQVRVARFSHATGFPLLARYRLEVAVEPVFGELQREDNFRVYEIIVPGSE
jgi:hypothetical protein